MSFSKIKDGYAITYSKGVYRKQDLYVWEEGLYIKYGTGFVRVYRNNQTSKDTLSIKHMNIPDDKGDIKYVEYGKASYVPNDDAQYWNIPSWVLTTAAKDLKKVLDDKTLVVDMDKYIGKTNNSLGQSVVCSACLGGAVLLGTVGVSSTDSYYDPDDAFQSITDRRTKSAILGLDMFRRGCLDTFFTNVTGKNLPHTFDPNPAYDWEKFSGVLTTSQTTELIELCELWAAKFKKEGY